MIPSVARFAAPLLRSSASLRPSTSKLTLSAGAFSARRWASSAPAHEVRFRPLLIPSTKRGELREADFVVVVLIWVVDDCQGRFERRHGGGQLRPPSLPFSLPSLPPPPPMLNALFFLALDSIGDDPRRDCVRYRRGGRSIQRSLQGKQAKSLLSSIGPPSSFSFHCRKQDRFRRRPFADFDSLIFAIGQVTKGLSEKFGEDRVIDVSTQSSLI